MIRFHGFILKELEIFWTNIRMFFHRNKTLFDILFLLIYVSEQGILFLLVSRFPNSVIGVVTGFILIFIATISFERICMESRYRELKERITEMLVEYEQLVAFIEIMKSKLKK